MERRQTEQSSSTALWSSWCGKNFSDRGSGRRTRLGSRRDQRFRQEKRRHSREGRGLASTQSTLFSKGRLILLDEVDGINLRADQAAVATILQIIKETQYPLILTANNRWDPKIRPLREACLQIELKRLGIRDGVPLLRSILNQE